MSKINEANELLINLCQQYSDLSQSDVEKILSIANSIEVIGPALDCDTFIDVPTRHLDGAIVVHHVKPKGKSNYIYSPVGQRAERENEPGVWDTLTTGQINKNIKAKTQENGFVTQDIYPIENDSKIIGTIIMERNISNDISKDFRVDEKSVKSLSKTLNSIHNINDYLDDIILIFDDQGRLLFHNLKADVFFRSSEIIEGKHFDELGIGNLSYSQLLSDKKFNYEVKVSDSYFLVKKIISQNEEWKIALILQDITQLKYKDEEILLKAIAIREVHHRIKNNLQTIASLLRIQLRRSQNKETKKVLRESVNRILSISATHELLSKDISDHVSLTEVIHFILKNIKRSYSENENINLHFTYNDQLLIDSDKATVVALIINELVQNCYDHAFTGMDKGDIDVNLYHEDRFVKISVKDDGIGYEHSEKDTYESLGMSIVKSYVKDKLKGNLSIQLLEKGTNVTFEFSL